MFTVIDRLAKGMHAIASACLVFLIVSAAGDVLLRALTGQGLRGAIEYGEVVLVAFAFLGLAHTQQRDGHVAVELVTSRFSPRVAALMELMAFAIALVFLAWMAWASVGEAINSVQSGEYRYGVVQAPVWPARLAIATGLAVLSAVVTVHLVRLGLIASGRDQSANHLEPQRVAAKDRLAS